jgi:V/A-type H+/Na+-transporting ATPase subunit C
MGGGVAEYSAIHARVRAMYSSLLGPQDWLRLCEAPDFNALVAGLKDTVYGPYLANLEERNLTPRRATYEVRRHLADVYTSITRAVPERVRPIISQLYRHFELGNLKAVLRGIVAGESWDVVRFVLFPFGPLGVLPAQAMVESGNVTAAVELLRGTPYYDTLSHAMPRYTSEQSLFPLEVALDLAYWRELWRGVSQLKSQDRTQALRIIGLLVDLTNLMWAIRYRVYHHLSEEEVINYTLSFGYRVRDENIRAIAAGADIAPVVSRIYPKVTDADTLLADTPTGLPMLELELQRAVADECRAVFSGYPFQIGIPLAFLILNEMEVQDLTVLIEAKAARMRADDFQPHLIMGCGQA